jgi:CBS domain-containing protein
MARNPVTCRPDDTVQEAARLMRDKHISSLAVTDNGTLVGILTTRDLTARVLAEGLPASTPVSEVMTADPLTLAPTRWARTSCTRCSNAGSAICRWSRTASSGIITQTDLTRFQAVSTAQLVRDAAVADSPRRWRRSPRASRSC